jgi:hypothetical protein
MTSIRIGGALASIALLSLLVAVALASSPLTPTVLARNGQQVTAQFGEPKGSTLGRCDPAHRVAEDPGTIDKKSTVTFALNHLPQGTQVSTFGAPPSCVATGTVACSGQGCDAFHQVVILEEGIGHDDVVLPAPVPGNVFIFTGSGTAPNPALAGWLDPANDELPDGVLAAGSMRQDLTYTFNKKGTYLVLCNVRGHYDAGMWFELEVDNVNLNKP